MNNIIVKHKTQKDLITGVPGRIEGLDVTRGIAVLGMIFMNFKIAMLQGSISTEYSLLISLEGRFGVLFIFMAGVGLSLMNRKALQKNDAFLIRRNRIKVLKRALFLFILGMIFSIFWFADIFHFYSFYLLAGVILIKRSKKSLFLTVLIIMFFTVILQLFFNWEKGWNFVSFSYTDFYTIPGFLRNLFFNGFHPIFPWLSFFILGMAVGKSNLNWNKTMKILLFVSLAVFILAETISFLSFSLSGILNGELSPIKYFFLSTHSFPAGPLFMLSAGAQAVFSLFAVIFISRKLNSKNIIITSFKECGKMVMTHYVLHLLLGLATLYVLAAVFTLNTLFIFIFSCVYFLLSIVFSLLWKKKFKFGPLELLMRKISS